LILWVADDFLGQGVPAVVKIGGGDAFDSWESDGGGQQAGALHADADNAKTEAVAGGNDFFQGGWNVLVLNQNVAGDGECSGGASGFLQKLTASGFHVGSAKK